MVSKLIGQALLILRSSTYAGKMAKLSTIGALEFLSRAKPLEAAAVCAVYGDEAYLKCEVLAALRRQVLGDERANSRCPPSPDRQRSSATCSTPWPPSRSSAAAAGSSIVEDADSVRHAVSRRARRLRRHDRQGRRPRARSHDLAVQHAPRQSRRRHGLSDRMQVAERTSNQKLAHRAGQVSSQHPPRLRRRRRPARTPSARARPARPGSSTSSRSSSATSA